MGMVVQHNMNAINSYNKLNANVAGMKKSSEKLSSGYRINRAGDDAAGLAVSEKMRSQIKGLNQAIRNSQDGINMIQTFEGAAQETHSILQRMKELASQSANGTYDNATDRAAIQLEFDQLNDELNQIADTDFNGTMVLNGGEMSDGTKVDGNGIINYQTATRSSQQVGSAGGFVKGIGARDYNDAYLAANDMTSETATFTAAVAADGKVTWTTNGKGALGSNTDNGGFTYAGVSVNVDSTKIVTGDTIVLDLSAKQEAKAFVSEVAGYNTVSSNIVGDIDTKLTFTVDAGLEADDIIADPTIADALNGLNGMTIEEKIADGETTPADATEITLNGLSCSKTAATKIFDVKGGGSVQLNKDGKTLEYVNGGTTTVLGALAYTVAKDAQAGGKSIKTNLLLTQASYQAPTSSGVELVEPEGKVSQSNSFTKSTAIMTYAENITLQTGARTKDSVNFTFNYNTDGSADMGELKATLNISARADGLNTENLSLATQEDANAAIDQIDKAINKVSMVRASFGSIQNRLEHKITNLTTTSENLTEAESSIRDTDMASEMMNYTKFNILQQAAQSMLAQANQQPQSILQLLG